MIKMLSKIAFILCACLALGSSQGDDSITLEINTNEANFEVIGTKNATWRNTTFYGFRGIPYAEPPINELRFRDPQPLRTQPKVIDARYEGHNCHSIYAVNASEDCLMLNVYTKELKPSTLMPVIVVIHPGGLYVCTGGSYYLGPEYLLTHDVVLVTFNYRLGTLGFLNLGTKEVPGNAGFKDQVYALRWVNQYIKHFGGNPDDVTLMGYSAGGLSVGLHLVSPMSKGLFHKGIVMSCAPLPQLKLPIHNQADLAVRQAQLLKCNVTSDNLLDEILPCLAHFNGAEIAKTLRGMFDFGKDLPVFLWMAVIEADHGQEAFLTKDFYDSMKNGDFQKVPLLIGWNAGEFCTVAHEILMDMELEARFYREYNDLAPTIFLFKGQNNEEQISASLMEHYLNDSSIGQTNFTRLCDLISDSLVRVGAQALTKTAAKHTSVYNYKFTHTSKHSVLDYKDINAEARTEHMDDMMFLFKMSQHYFTPDDEEAHIVDLYTKFMYDFVVNGKLNSNEAGEYPDSYAEINNKIQRKTDEYFKDGKFWENLF